MSQEKLEASSVSPSENGSSHLVNSFFCLLVSCFLFFLHCLLRLNAELDFSTGFKFIGFLSFFLFFPFLAATFISRARLSYCLPLISLEPIFLLLLLLFSGISGYILGIDIANILAFCGYGAFLFALVQGRLWRILPVHWGQLLGGGSLAFVAALWIAGILFTHKYHNALFMEKLHVGQTSIDTLFHSGILNMIKNYHAFSCGIDGLVPIKYHMGSHWLFAQWSKLLGVEGLQFYLLGYALLAVPLFIKAALTLAAYLQAVLRRDYAEESGASQLERLFIFVFGIVGVLSYDMAFKTGFWYGFIGTESYTLAMTIFMLIICLAVTLYRVTVDKRLAKKDRLIVCLPLTVFMIIACSCTVFTKLSVAFVGLLLLGFFVLRLALWRKVYWFLSLLVLAVISFAIFQSCRPPVQSAIVPFNFYREWIGPIYIWLHLPLFYGWPMAVILFQLKDNNITDFRTFMAALKERRLLLSEACLVFALICTSPAMILAFTAGLVHTFMEPQLVFSFVVFAGVFSSGRLAKLLGCSRRALVVGSVIPLILLMVYPLTDSALNLFRENLKARSLVLIESGDIAEVLKPFVVLGQPFPDLRSLERVYTSSSFELSRITRSLPSHRAIGGLLRLSAMDRGEKKKHLLFIPQKITAYWDDLVENGLTTPYIAPALSGLAMVDGLPKYGTPLSVYYGLYHHDYGRRAPDPQDDSDQHVSMLAALKGFRFVFYVEDNLFKFREIVYREPKPAEKL